MKYTALISHLEKFTSGTDRSLEWAQDAEALMEEFEECEQMLDELQDALSFYSPGGGGQLVDEAAMLAMVEKVLPSLKV